MTSKAFRPWIHSKVRWEFDNFLSNTPAFLCHAFSPSDVFTILQEIQRTWSYLEPLFIGSEEVKKELPEDAKRFEGIDTDVKGLLKSVSRTTFLHKHGTRLKIALKEEAHFLSWSTLTGFVENGFWLDYEQPMAILLLFFSWRTPFPTN